MLCATGNCLRGDSNVVSLFEGQKLIFIIFAHFLLVEEHLRTQEVTSQTSELFISSIISCNSSVDFHKVLVFSKLALQTSHLSNTLMQYSIYSGL